MKRLILTEKPSVAKSFANALNCHYSPKTKTFINEGDGTEIVNCVGHLFNLANPEFYDKSYRNWSLLPIIPESFKYEVNENTKDVCKLVISKLKAYSKSQIIIATDADREGEIIARECLYMAEITDYSNIKRFWESEALTKQVILKGLQKAKNLSSFDRIADQGFVRQKADWLCGINFTRYLATKVDKGFRVGRVQTALLSEIKNRCDSIESFVPEKYFEAEGLVSDKNGNQFKVIYEDDKGNKGFTSESSLENLQDLIGKKIEGYQIREEDRISNPPELYNLCGLQKDCFRFFDLSAQETLEIVQKLYEQYKCVSYPRTPSVVMGFENVGLCQDVFSKLVNSYPQYLGLLSYANISKDNKRVFDNSRLEAHHALIPLDTLPEQATEKERFVYSLLLERFMLAFAPKGEYKVTKAFLHIGDAKFVLEGQTVINKGWKSYIRFTKTIEDKDEVVDLTSCDFSSLVLDNIIVREKKTKAPKYYNEASLIGFMEKPVDKLEEGRLVGLGTAATRHTFVPKLAKYGYILEGRERRLLITDKGRLLLEAVRLSKFKKLLDVKQTTIWESKLMEDPIAFLGEIKDFVASSV